MHHRYFPPRPIDGPIEPPIPYAHMVSLGAVPYKCSRCQRLFEGECLRYVEDVGHYLHLDYGPCGISGPTDPVLYKDRYIEAGSEVPRKCTTCVHLAVDRTHGFHCTKESDKRGDFHRGLDWATWHPEIIYLELPSPRSTARALLRYAFNNDLVGSIKEYKGVNPGLSMKETRKDFMQFREYCSVIVLGTVERLAASLRFTPCSQ